MDEGLSVRKAAAGMGVDMGRSRQGIAARSAASAPQHVAIGLAVALTTIILLLERFTTR